ncbi:MAG: hypothetical protein IPK04_14790 [Bdellovibrionales bacterium]|nr:hypothetical protein [Bdellovibrionales bacterium]
MIFYLFIFAINFILMSQAAYFSTNINLALKKDGKPEQPWLSAIGNRNSQSKISEIAKKARPLSKQEQEWLKALRKTVLSFEENKRRVEEIFPTITPPINILILVGNQGGDDGFTYENSSICLDLSKWVENYGEVKTNELLAEDRINRILLHEYAHLLTKIWAKSNPQDVSTPYKRALYEMFYEGIGNYFSLSIKWIDSKGNLTEKAKSTQEQLIPILRERLKKLKSDNGSNEMKLRKGLSTGTFDQKWGALPVALWLAEMKIKSNQTLIDQISRGSVGIEEVFTNK